MTVHNEIHMNLLKKKDPLPPQNSVLVVAGLGRMARFLCVFKPQRILRYNQLGSRAVNISLLFFVS